MEESYSMEQFVSDVPVGHHFPITEAASKDHLLLPSFSPNKAPASISVLDTE